MTAEKQPDQETLQVEESKEDRIKRVTEELEKTPKGKEILAEKQDDNSCCG